jgi:putative transposase
VSAKADRFYVSVLVDENIAITKQVKQSDGIGIDVGVKEFAVISDGRKFKNINKTAIVKRLEKSLKRHQRSLSRKYEFKKKRGVNSTTKNITKRILRVQKLHCKLSNIRLDYIRKTAHTLVKTKPEYITIEDLNIKGMMKNRHLSKAISKQNFYKFTELLMNKCKQFGVELRKVNKFCPSSKKCNVCGNIKKDLKLSDRIYKCNICGYQIDRDIGAGINLAMAKEYTIVT